MRSYPHSKALYRAGVGEEPSFGPGIELFAAVRDSQVLADEVFGLQESGDLLRVSLIDLEVTVEATDVQDFAVTADHLLYSVAGVEPAVLLRDRNTTDEIVVAPAPIYKLTIRDGAALSSEDHPYHNTIVTLDDGQIDPLPVGRKPHSVVEDGRWMLSDLVSGDEVLLSTRVGQRSWSVEQLWILEGAEPTGDIRQTGALWRISYNGEPDQLQAHRASPHIHRLSDERIVTTVDVDGAWVGELLLVEPETLDEVHIAEPVFHYSHRQVRSGSLDPDVIAYQLLDGEQTGVYLVNLGL